MFELCGAVWYALKAAPAFVKLAELAANSALETGQVVLEVLCHEENQEGDSPEEPSQRP